MTTGTDTRICDIDFTVPPWGKRMATRVQNALQRGGIMTLGQLLQYTETDLECVDEGIGIVSMVIINRKLKELGHKLKEVR